MARLNIIPEPAFLDLKPLLLERLAQIAADIHAEEFGSLMDPLARRILLQGFAEAGANEGTAWLLDAGGEHLVPGFNSGPHADQLVGKFKQPLNEGLICMVFATEQPFLENEVWKNTQQSKRVDSLLNLQTQALIAVPFYFLNACRGVISCVQLKTPGSSEPDSPGFHPENLASVQHATALLSQLIEYRLLSRAIGWTTE